MLRRKMQLFALTTFLLKGERIFRTILVVPPQSVVYLYCFFMGMEASSIPDSFAIRARDVRLKKLLCSRGATGLRDFFEPSGEVQSMILSRRCMSPAAGTCILSIPSAFKAFFRWHNVANGSAMCSNTFSALMKSNRYFGISSHVMTLSPFDLAWSMRASDNWVYPGFPTLFWGLSGFFVNDLMGKALWSSWKTRSVFQGAVGAFCASTAPSASTGPICMRQDRRVLGLQSTRE